MNCQAIRTIFDMSYGLCMTSFSLTSTRIISEPIRQTWHQGIQYSHSCKKKPQIFPLDGTIRVQIQPLFSSISRSITRPRHLAVHTLITSFVCNSHKSMAVHHKIRLSTVYVESLDKSHFEIIHWNGKGSHRHPVRHIPCPLHAPELFPWLLQCCRNLKDPGSCRPQPW